MLRAENLRKRFGDKVVFDAFDLEVRRGETLALIGRSGAGKSVFLKLVLGLIRPDGGRILLGGIDLVSLGEKELVEVRRRIGMVFQGGALFDSMTVAENVAYGLMERGLLPRQAVRARVAECLALVDLAGTEDLLPGALSGGMRKRVAIARAIAPQPELLLYDEPTTGLDPATAGRIDALIVDLQRRLGVTSIVVTHDMECVKRVSNRITLIEGGRNAWTGETAILLRGRELPPPLRRFLSAEEEGLEWKQPDVSP